MITFILELLVPCDTKPPNKNSSVFAKHFVI